MRNLIHTALAVIGLATGATLFAADLVIEDDNLKDLPEAAVAVMRASADGVDFKACKFIGAQVDLDGDGQKTDWAATTADGCGWGASIGPIWLLRADGKGFVLVLSAGGYDLTLGADTQNGLRHVAIAAATAGHRQESLWKFDGIKYVRTRERKRVAH